MKAKIFMIAVVAVLLFAPGVYAWDNDVHTQMVKDAIALCPKELKFFLKQHIRSVISGSQEPTLSLTSPTSYGYNYRKSYYIPEGERGTAPEEVKLISHSVIELLSKRSSEEDLIARRMGMICSYASDSIQPKRYIGVAPNYPLDYLVNEKRLTITYNGHNAIDDFSGDLKKLVKGTWDQDLDDEQYYDLAVNFVVDVWVSIWEKGGLPPGEMIVVGSQIRPVPKGEIEAKKTPVKPDTYFDLEKLEKANIYKDTDLKKYDKEEEGFKVDMERGEEETTTELPEEAIKEPGEETETETESTDESTVTDTEETETVD